MAAATQNTTERRAMLRRVAIVISSLPEPTGRMLLGSLGAPMKADVNRILRSLNDVDPLERRRAIEAFRTSIGGKSSSSVPSLAPATEDEFVRSSATNSVASQTQNGSPVSSSDGTLDSESGNHLAEDDSPLRFLADLDDPTLVAMLNVESAQTIAIVFSSLAPHQAARLLPQIASHLQRQVVLRLGRLGEVPEFAATELADHFQGVLDRRKASRSESKSSTNAVLEAILASLPRDAQPADNQRADNQHPDTQRPNDQRPVDTSAAPSSANTQAHPDHRTPSTAGGNVAAPLRSARPVRDRSTRDERTDDVRSRPHAAPPADPIANSPHVASLDRAIRNLQDTMPDRFDDPADPDLGTRATIPIRPGADRTQRHQNQGHQNQHDDAKTPAQGHRENRPAATRNAGGTATASPSTDQLSTDQVEQRLKSLSPQQLCHSLARVNTRQAVLTLCGVSPSLADATLALLPKTTADTVRAQMLSLQTMNLREIDRAKSAVAAASLALEAAQADGPPSDQGVASAA